MNIYHICDFLLSPEVKSIADAEPFIPQEFDTKYFCSTLDQKSLRLLQGKFGRPGWWHRPSLGLMLAIYFATHLLASAYLYWLVTRVFT